MLGLYIATARNFFHFLVVSLVLLHLTGVEKARGERTAACLPVVTFNGKREGSRRTDGRVSPCCYLQWEATRLTENGRPRVSLFLPSTGSDQAHGERTATCLPVVTFNGKLLEAMQPVSPPVASRVKADERGLVGIWRFDLRNFMAHGCGKGKIAEIGLVGVDPGNLVAYGCN